MSKHGEDLPSPCYLLDESRLRTNLQLIAEVKRAGNCQIILALKGFAMWSAFPLVRQFLSGCATSSLYETRLAKKWFGGHVHLYAPAYDPGDFSTLIELADRITFNSLEQWLRFGEPATAAGISCGLRVNPGVDEVATPLYNPCGPQSRLGISPTGLGANLPRH